MGQQKSGGNKTASSSSSPIGMQTICI